MILKDIQKLTTTIFDKFIKSDENINAPKNIYDTYRKLEVMIDNINLVANHYLALDFKEEFLQNSSFGTPQDKWRQFFNKDLEQLNASIKKYIFKLYYIGFEDERGSFMTQLYSIKSFYAFVRDEYNIGFIEPCSCILIQTTLNTKFDKDRFHNKKFNKMDLTTFEQRKQLQKELQMQSKFFTEKLEELRQYIFKRYTMEDLLPPKKIFTKSC